MKKNLEQSSQQRKTVNAKDVRDRKREQILHAAENLFFRHGYAGTTIAGIATKLGVTKPYLYYYFQSKDDIFETLCWEASVACLTSMHFDAGDARPAADKLREGLHRLASANIIHFKSGTFAYREPNVFRPAMSKKLRALARTFYDEFCVLLEQARNEGALDYDNTKLTALAVGSVIGFMYTWYKPGGPIAPTAMAEQLTTILLKTVGAQKL